MNQKHLYVINAALLVAVAGGAVFYLFPSRPKISAEADSKPALSSRTQDRRAGGSSMASAAVMAPSERELSNAELERQRRGEPETQSTQGVAVEHIPVTMPLAALEPDTEMNLDRGQLDTLQALRQAFADAMSQAGDPSSPQYLEQWLVAQSQLDEQLQIFFGDEVYTQFNLKGVAAGAGQGK